MRIRRRVMVDANEAVASVAYRTNEVIAIYPITPASPMGELADEWSQRGRANLWGAVPCVTQMQSEAGAAGAVHGALQAGALATTFTASQGLLLMIPNMYKIAGELTAFCMHVAARTVATHALSIFGDHSDVMACRQTGFALLASGSVQEAQDLACIGQAATLKARVPILHFFDGFRTSHEIAKIEELEEEDLRHMIDAGDVRAHRERGLSPDRPVLRGTAQNPDTFFQAREACNSYYAACPRIVLEAMDRFAQLTGRRYGLFDYVGHPEAERVVVMMGSGAETAHETIDWLAGRGERVGLLKVRLFRPFAIEAFAAALPRRARAIAVLDRTKEPGAVGEPLHLEVVAALHEAAAGGAWPGPPPRVIGGRYGLASKEFTPAMVQAVFDELGRKQPRSGFTVGIVDDVTHTSLKFDPELDIEPEDVARAVFFGLGSDGTVGANKNSIRLIGSRTEKYAQGYFVYDSKKAGATTISHLRFAPRPIRSAYGIQHAGFVACHQFSFLERQDVLACAAPGAVFLLNAPGPAAEVWDRLPLEVQQQIVDKKLRLHVIDAHKVAREAGLGTRINTVMQACFFALMDLLPAEEAVAGIKESIRATYGEKGDLLVERNFAAVDNALANLHAVRVPDRVTSAHRRAPAVSSAAPEFVQRVTAVMLAGKGDLLPVSAFPVDGTWPVGTSRWEKRAIAQEIPIWDPAVCIQCNKCALVCPHAAIRATVYPADLLAAAPPGWRSNDFRGPDFEGFRYTIQVAPEDCTGCRLCVNVCPARDRSNPRHKAIDMEPLGVHREREVQSYAFFLGLPEPDRGRVRLDNKGTQFLEPLFEYSGACAGCGETPYIKLLTQLFGDRLLIANATGCSSIYGGNLPTTPYTRNRDGRGPAWSNSLFEDNAEFGYGVRLGLDTHVEQARRLLRSLAPRLGEALVDGILEAGQEAEADIAAQRLRVRLLRERLAGLEGEEARGLDFLADYLVRKCVWLVGGDGWAYDIGYGGVDHVLSTDAKVNMLVLDTEVYSNTGGQQSKATPLGAAAKFAVAGKSVPKKDIGMMAMSYGHVYVARIAFGASDNQTVRALAEADAYPGPSLVIAYSHCIAHGYDMALGAQQQKLAVDCGTWPLYRYDPRRIHRGEPPLQLDSGPPKISLEAYRRNEARFRLVERRDPERFRLLSSAAQRVAAQRISMYRHMAQLTLPETAETGAATSEKK
jgi:pyruvate-ferredoxin/flavodoxin oxidoreductase